MLNAASVMELVRAFVRRDMKATLTVLKVVVGNVKLTTNVHQIKLVYGLNVSIHAPERVAKWRNALLKIMSLFVLVQEVILETRSLNANVLFFHVSRI